MEKIKLGDRVRDKISGYEGIAVARVEFLNGCIQYTVARKLKKGQEVSPAGEPSFDSYSLEVVKPKVIESREYQDEPLGFIKMKRKEKERPSGGPITFNKGVKGW